VAAPLRRSGDATRFRSRLLQCLQQSTFGKAHRGGTGNDSAQTDALTVDAVDGVETTRRIRDRYHDVAVVVLTSYGEGRHVRAALDAGASGYLLKDADADEVAASLRAAHRGELQLDAAVTRSLVGAPQGGTSNPAAALTSRELEVLGLVGAGNPNKAIARELAITERTTRSHVSSILAKLGLSSRTQLALWAVRNGLASGGDAADDSQAVSA